MKKFLLIITAIISLAICKPIKAGEIVYTYAMPKVTFTHNTVKYRGRFKSNSGIKVSGTSKKNKVRVRLLFGKVNTKKVGRYKLTYLVTDHGGHFFKKNRTVYVKKKVKKTAKHKRVKRHVRRKRKVTKKRRSHKRKSVHKKKSRGKKRVKKNTRKKVRRRAVVTKIKTQKPTPVEKPITAPKITFDKNTYDEGDDFDPKAGMHISADPRDHVEVEVQSNKVNLDREGTYDIIYDVESKSGNHTFTRHVTVNHADVLYGVEESEEFFAETDNNGYFGKPFRINDHMSETVQPYFNVPTRTDLLKKVKWKNSDPSVATVDPITGEVTRKKPGLTIITVSLKNHSYWVPILVLGKEGIESLKSCNTDNLVTPENSHSTTFVSHTNEELKPVLGLETDGTYFQVKYFKSGIKFPYKFEPLYFGGCDEGMDYVDLMQFTTKDNKLHTYYAKHYAEP